MSDIKEQLVEDRPIEDRPVEDKPIEDRPIEDRPWREWLEFDRVLKKQGKQGMVGLMRNIENNKLYIFKLSKYINHLINHEAAAQNQRKRNEYAPDPCCRIAAVDRCVYTRFS